MLETNQNQNQIRSFILSLNSQFTIMIYTCQHKIKNKLPGKGFQKSVAYLARLPSWTKYYNNVVLMKNIIIMIKYDRNIKICQQCIDLVYEMKS